MTSDAATDQLEAVQDIFRQVRPRILAAAGKDIRSNKHDGSPVTDTDIEVEEIVQAEMARRFPGLPVFGEESSYDEDNLPPACWLIDPIDGTKSFLENTPAYTCMAVLIQDGAAVAAAIYNPFYDAMYTAIKGRGAYKNGQRLKLADQPLPSVAYGRERLVAVFNEILKPKGVTCEPGPTGAGYGFSRVAEGSLAARFNFPHKPGGGNPHDYAPGALLVTEAGGAIVPFEEGDYTFQTRSFAACHPALESLIRQNAQRLRSLEIKSA